MEPEIARRCKSCGAAIRARSAFCPQCGAAVNEGNAAATTAPNVSASVADDAAAAVAAPENSQRRAADSMTNAETIAPVVATTEAPAKTEVTMMTESPAATSIATEDVASPMSPVEPSTPAETIVPAAISPEAVIEKMQRVRAAPGTTTPRDGADDGVRNRADKLRRASNVVLDEAAADPSLRFVLVATALIIISLVLLLLARVI